MARRGPLGRIVQWFVAPRPLPPPVSTELAERVTELAAKRDVDAFLRSVEQAAVGGEEALRTAVVRAIERRLDSGDPRAALALFSWFRRCSTLRVDVRTLRRLATVAKDDDPQARRVRRELEALQT